VNANIVAVAGTPVSSTTDFKATGFSTFDATSDTVKANVISVSGTTVTSPADFKATGFSTFDSSSDTVQANVAQVAGNVTAAVSLQQNIVRLDQNISAVDATVNSAAVAAAIFATTIDGSVEFDTAIQRILAMTVNAQIISGSDPITLVGRNSANTANVVIQSHPVAVATGRSVTF
jgi:hypothetical protein